MNALASMRRSTRLGSALSSLVALCALAGALFAFAATACSDDDSTVNNYIGESDAAPPRLGSEGDAGNSPR